MLRAKQLGSLSQSARSFFWSGSRCDAADGSSCSCTEDETCISKRPQTRDEIQRPHSYTTVASKTSAVGSVVPVDGGKAASLLKVKNVTHPVSEPQVISSAPPLHRVESDNYVVCAGAGNMMQQSPPIADQFAKAGIAAVSFFSDIVNYRIPTSDGNGGLSSSPQFMVDHRKPVSVRSSNVKTSRKEKVHVNSSSEGVSGSNFVSSSHGPKGRGEKSTPVKSPNNVLDNCSENSGKSFGTPSNSTDRRQPEPQRYNNYSNQCTNNARNSERKFVGEFADVSSMSIKKTQVQNGVGPTVRRFSGSAVVENVSQILRQFRWGPSTEEQLGRLNYLMDAYQANQILKDIKDYNVALGFFYWLKRQPGFKHDGHTYTTMVGILGRARQFEAINKLLDQMVRDGCQPNVVTYNRLIHSYGRANYLNEAMSVFNQMRKMGCEPDRVTYCTLIDIHAKAGYLDVALDMYDRMQEAGLSPDTFTYSVIINCLGKAGHLAAAHKLFSEMVNQGCVPNLVTYNIMLALHAKARNYSTALQLYRDMQNAGFEPDKVTYSIVMEVLGHCGYLEEAEGVFAEMKRRNWVPDEPVYGLLVDLWGKAGNVEKAGAWYQAMLNAGLRPNVPTCNSLLSALLRVHRLPEAFHLLQDMLHLGLKPSLQTYTLLLSCCTEAQTSVEMGFCCQLMAVTCHPAHTFLLTMPASGPDGQKVRDHASSFLDMMHSEDRESKRGLIDAVVDFLHKTGLKEEAGSVWEVAAQKNVYPDAVREKSSSYWLINLHVMSDGTAVIALSRTLAWFRKQMILSGTCPNRIDIVTGWGRRSRVTGTSLVRQAVQDLLKMFYFPFHTESGNSGCFVGCGDTLNRWLLQPYVERMHLL
ncbi:hypothetical protein LIER_24473 [Lithospermum erythrorhizon]|uniref:Smr domain-containing protein n=1 Tax=Lithospermum erythrorhizon TaxID=34254 RepID=A0AAV3R1E6_LITER